SSSDNEPDDNASLGSLFAYENNNTNTHCPTSLSIHNHDNFNTSLLTHNDDNINTPLLPTNNDDITIFQVSSSADNLTSKQLAQFQQFNNEKVKLTRVDEEDNLTSTSTNIILNKPVSKLSEIDQ
ncbi:9731_t:CDS:2, partial [Dentiscutata heterogama]